MSYIKTALITGAARRIGAALAQHLHGLGMNVVVHYNRSDQDAKALVNTLNAKREGSAIALQGDLLNAKERDDLIPKTLKAFGGLDVLINNASSFYPTPVDDIEHAESAWEDLMGSNLKSAYFLSVQAAPYLEKQTGCIINISAIHGKKPLKGYPIYSIAKAGVNGLTKSLAKELAPHIRVNAIAPGAIIWPEKENALDEKQKERLLSEVPLARQGNSSDIARACEFLICHAPYVTGEMLTVDGGRSL